ncbi:uncharacterized protein LOC123697576 [Colias croceus]|uniref:uncharacterized protein LOC123697576 n=1 Tax=Colias crocea TaxID=72248 RepID=UPI001E27FDA5|nr:uncharacterized protein LOC123697576 [Colias croceus]
MAIKIKIISSSDNANTCLHAVQLWEKYKDKFSEDFLRNISNNDEGTTNDNFRDLAINQCLLALQDELTAVGGKSLCEYGLPTPTSVGEVTNREYSAEIGYNLMELLTTLENGVPMMTAEQRSVYDRVCGSVQNNLGTIWFLDAPGGTGKTFLTKLILAYVRNQRKIALAVASSGIAATLLPGGKTAHTMFKIPIDLDRTESPTCSISRNSDKAKVLRECNLIIWDECTMAHRKAVEAVDRTLRDIRQNDRPMGGITVLFCGDFRQTLPAYAPTENSLQEEIDCFYDDLANAHDTVSTEYIFSMGDFNAQIGIPEKFERPIAGEYGYGIRSARDLLMAQNIYNAEEYYQQIIHHIKSSLSNIKGSQKNKILSAKKAFKELNQTKSWVPFLHSGDNKCKSRTEIIKTATDFYANLYREPPAQKQTKTDYHYTDTTPTVQFTEKEILKQIMRLKPEKSPGPDGITNECIKVAQTLLLTPITILWNKILEDEAVPHQWLESEITLLYKKGDPADLGNYRPISLMSSFYKLFASCLLERIGPVIDSHQPIEQAGFRSGFSTLDHIQVVDQVIEKFSEFNKPLYLAFVDYKKAFDTISHESIWESLKALNINKKYINILNQIYNNSTSKVKLDRVGEPFKIRRGVRQGDPISPKLFIAVLQHVLGKLPWSNRGINMNGNMLSHLRFADDIILFAENPHHLSKMINELNQASKNIGLEINIDKTKIMTNHTETPILLDSPLEYVNKYIYLGKQISFSKERNLEEVNRRVAITWSKFWSFKEILKSQLPLATKKIVMDTALLPCLTYGCPTWTFDHKIRYKIQTSQRRMERSCLGIKLRDRIKNIDIRKKTKVCDALGFSLKGKWKWAGHLARYKDDRWTLRSVKWSGPRGTRTRGRPKARWADEIVAVAGGNWLNLAQNRDKWHSLGEAFTRTGSI